MLATATQPKPAERIRGILSDIADRENIAQDYLVVQVGRKIVAGLTAKGESDRRKELFENESLGQQFLDTLESEPGKSGPAIKISKLHHDLDSPTAAFEKTLLYDRSPKGEIRTNSLDLNFEALTPEPLSVGDVSAIAGVIEREPGLGLETIRAAIDRSRQPALPLADRQQIAAAVLPQPELKALTTAVAAEPSLQAVAELVDPAAVLAAGEPQTYAYEGFELVVAPKTKDNAVEIAIGRDGEPLAIANVFPDGSLDILSFDGEATPDLLLLQRAGERLQGRDTATERVLPDLNVGAQVRAIAAAADVLEGVSGLDEETQAFLQAELDGDLSMAGLLGQIEDETDAAARRALGLQQRFEAAAASRDALQTQLSAETLPGLAVLEEHWIGDAAPLDAVGSASRALSTALETTRESDLLLAAAATDVLEISASEPQQQIARAAAAAIAPEQPAVRAAAEVAILPPEVSARRQFEAQLDTHFGKHDRAAEAATVLAATVEPIEVGATDLVPEVFAATKEKMQGGLQQLGHDLREAATQAGQALERAVQAPIEGGRTLRRALTQELATGELQPVARFIERGVERERDFKAAVAETFAPLGQFVQNARLQNLSHRAVAAFDAGPGDGVGIAFGEGAQLRSLAGDRFELTVEGETAVFAREGRKLQFERRPQDLSRFLAALDLNLQADRFQIQAETLQGVLETAEVNPNSDDLVAAAASLETAAEDVARANATKIAAIPVTDLQEQPLVGDAVGRYRAIADDNNPLGDRPVEDVFEETEAAEARRAFIQEVLPHLIVQETAARQQQGPRGAFSVESIEAGEAGVLYEVRDTATHGLLFSATGKDGRITGIPAFNLGLDGQAAVREAVIPQVQGIEPEEELEI